MCRRFWAFCNDSFPPSLLRRLEGGIWGFFSVFFGGDKRFIGMRWEVGGFLHCAVGVCRSIYFFFGLRNSTSKLRCHQ